MADRGRKPPDSIQSEALGKVARGWLGGIGVKTLLTVPGSPCENGCNQAGVMPRRSAMLRQFRISFPTFDAKSACDMGT